VTQVSSSAPLRGSGLIRKTIQLIRGYQLKLQVPVVDYDSNTTVNGNAGINIAGQVTVLGRLFVHMCSAS
jgi:hypothetical protein